MEDLHGRTFLFKALSPLAGIKMTGHPGFEFYIFFKIAFGYSCPEPVAIQTIIINFDTLTKNSSKKSC